MTLTLLRRLPLTLLLWAGAALAQDVITLPAEAPARRTAELQEAWRVGGYDETDPLLGLVATAVMDAQGNTYLLDRQLAQVLVLSPTGAALATLGREGDGPGELRRPIGVFLREDGVVGVIQSFPGKVVYLDAAGNPAGTIEFGGEAVEGGRYVARKVVPHGGEFVGQIVRSTFDRAAGKAYATDVLGVFDTQGHEVRRFASHDTEREFMRPVWDEAAEFSELSRWTLLPDGRVCTAPERDAYVIRVRDLEGRILSRIEREFTPRRRSAEDKAVLLGYRVMFRNGRRIEPEDKGLDTDPVILGLSAATDGRLFVTNCYQNVLHLEPGVAGRFDVLGPGGEFLEELTLTAPGFDPTTDRLRFLDGRHWLVIRNHEDAARAMFQNRRGEEAEAAEDFTDVEPLEVVLYTLP